MNTNFDVIQVPNIRVIGDHYFLANVTIGRFVTGKDLTNVQNNGIEENDTGTDPAQNHHQGPTTTTPRPLIQFVSSIHGLSKVLLF